MDSIFSLLRLKLVENQKTRKPENQKTRKPENQKTRKPEERAVSTSLQAVGCFV
jgi:hypothetical protein